MKYKFAKKYWWKYKMTYFINNRMYRKCKERIFFAEISKKYEPYIFTQLVSQYTLSSLGWREVDGGRGRWWTLTWSEIETCSSNDPWKKMVIGHYLGYNAVVFFTDQKLIFQHTWKLVLPFKFICQGHCEWLKFINIHCIGYTLAVSFIHNFHSVNSRCPS